MPVVLAAGVAPKRDGVAAVAPNRPVLGAGVAPNRPGGVVGL